MKRFSIFLVAAFFPVIVFAAAPSVLKVQQGGTGAATFTAGNCLIGNGTGPITSQTCSGGGSNSKWATSTGSTIIPNGGGGIFVNASSTVGDGNANGGLTIFGGATTTGTHVIGNTGTLRIVPAVRFPQLAGFSSAGTQTSYIQLGATAADEIAIGSANAKVMSFYSQGTYTGSGPFFSVDLSSATQPFFAYGTDGPTVSTRDTSIGRVSAGVIGIGTGTAGSSAGTLIVTTAGIGTTAPTTTLDVSGTPASGIPVFRVASGGNTTGLFTGSGVNYLMGFNSTAAVGTEISMFEIQRSGVRKWDFNLMANTNDLTIFSQGTNSYPFRIQASTGNIGIATSSPYSLLSVAGRGVFQSLIATSTTEFSGFGTSTPGSLLSIQGIANFTTATTTFYSTGGIVLTGGCLTYTVGGACVGGSSGSSASSTLLVDNNTWTGTNTYNTSPTIGVNTNGLLLGGSTFLYASSTNFDTIVGIGAGGQSATTSSNTIGTTAVGFNALAKSTNTASAGNTAVGYLSLQNSTGIGNVAVGYNTGTGLTTGTNNTLVGKGALFNSGTGSSDNVAIGVNAINANGNTAGNKNVSIGSKSGTNENLTGSANILIGAFATAPSLSSNSQLNIGNVLYGQNMYNNTTLSGNPVTNGNIGISTTTPWGKLAISLNSGDTNLNAFLISSSTDAATTTLFVVDRNGNVGISTTTPGSILAIQGVANFTTATTTHQSTGGIDLKNGGCFAINGTCIGGSSGSSASSTLLVDNNTFSGSNVSNGSLSLGVNTNGLLLGGNTFAYASSTNGASIFGINTGGNNATTSTTLNGTSAFGVGTLSQLTTGAGNSAFGYQALNLATTSPQNTAFGYQALKGSTLGTFSVTGQNTAFGYQALTANTTANSNTAMGYQAMKSITTGGSNVAIGYNALGGSTVASFNVAVGINALSGAINVNSNNSVAVGGQALQFVTSSTDNTAVGVSAGRDVGTGLGGNTFVGKSTGGNLGGATTMANNTGLGAFALFNADNGSFGNTAIGYQAGVNLSSGYDNIIIGETQNTGGNNLTTGGGNILIGYNPLLESATQNRRLSIGNSLFGILPATSSATTLGLPTGNSFGIGTSTPWGKLSIQANSGDTFPYLFTIASSTPAATTTLFAVANSGWVVTSGTKPTASSCGTGSVVDGNQTMGNVEFTGTLVTTCTITFPSAVPTGTTLQCVVSDDSTTGFPTVAATTTSSLRIGISAGLSAGTLYWHCQATRNDGN